MGDQLIGLLHIEDNATRLSGVTRNAVTSRHYLVQIRRFASFIAPAQARRKQ